MINIIVNELTNKILGYNFVGDETNPDPDYILVDNSELDILNGLRSGKHLYYVDGKITEQEVDDYTKEAMQMAKDNRTVRKDVVDEQKVFMDNILSGMDISEAKKIVQANRNKKDKSDKELQKILDKQKKEEEKKIKQKLKDEEKNISNDYYLSMVAIVRDENEYLKEWIDWHLNLGFEHFFIYDNESETPIQKYLESIDYENLHKVTAIDWKTSKVSQQDAYNHFLKNYRKVSKWFLIADPDEFVYMKDTTKTLVDYLKEKEDYEAIKCSWVHFNANGHETKSEETQVERFTTTTDCMDYLNGGKHFAQANRVKKFNGFTPEIRFSKDDSTTVLEEREYFQLNHYFTRSYEEWIEKMERGTVLPYSTRTYQDFFKANPDMEYLNNGENYIQVYGSPAKKQTQESIEEETKDASETK